MISALAGTQQSCHYTTQLFLPLNIHSSLRAKQTWVEEGKEGGNLLLPPRDEQRAVGNGSDAWQVEAGTPGRQRHQLSPSQEDAAQHQ